MTGSRIERLAFTADSVRAWSAHDARRSNWPVVYTIDNRQSIYVGETGNILARMRQHLTTKASLGLDAVQVIVDDTFNKSACLDLESFLIRLFAGDGKYTVLNLNEGITDAEYFDRARYQERFSEIFDELRDAGYFQRTIPQIVNSDLFKLSPFKALTNDQAIAVEDIVEGLFQDLVSGAGSSIVIQGEPGTGKTILAIYLMKLLVDIRAGRQDEVSDDSMFADFFTPGYPELLAGFRMALVVPQQSLRDSIKKVFHKTPGLHRDMVLTPFDVGKSAGHFDLLIVDEAHRLTQLSAQAMGTLTKDFRTINAALFGPDSDDRTQLDWIRAKSTHALFMVDMGQRVRPADVSLEALGALVNGAKARDRVYPLTTQMRVSADADYVGYTRSLLRGEPQSPRDFGDYELRLFDDFDAMYALIRQRDQDEGLARLVAGYAWPWHSRKTGGGDIPLGSHVLPWNRTTVDWVNSPGSIDQVGSIHTIQGYDLNYAGVIIGKDLRYDPEAGRTWFDRSNYFDVKGRSNNGIRGITYSDDDILEFVTNIYGVLMSRGIRGTFVYVCDDHLRDYLRPYLELQALNPPP